MIIKFRPGDTLSDAENLEMRGRLKIAEEALEFYANKSNWEDRWVCFNGEDDREGDVYDVITEDDVDILEDDDGPYMDRGGKRARKALEAIRATKGGSDESQK